MDFPPSPPPEHLEYVEYVMCVVHLNVKRREIICSRHERFNINQKLYFLTDMQEIDDSDDVGVLLKTFSTMTLRLQSMLNYFLSLISLA